MSTSSINPQVRKRVEYYVRCQALPGMFPDELLVYVDAIMSPDATQATRVELLVDANLVINLTGTPQRGKPVGGQLRVSLTNQKNGFSAIILPQPSVPHGPTIVVKTTDLVEAPAAGSR